MTIMDCEKQLDKIPGKTGRLCKKKKVLAAINVLKALNQKFIEGETKKQPLLEEATECPVLLQVSMKKIPPKRMVKRIKVPLPHPMVTDTTEVCLFTGDLDKRDKKAEIDPDVLHYKELLKEQGITKVTEVIPLRQLRTEYKVYEARRQLMAAYDVFLCDKKIAQCLPKLLGKIFIKKRKFPIQIDMKTSTLKSQIENALSATVFSVNCRGNSCASEVARLGMDDNEILENILASVKVLADKLPGEQNNIFGIYIKTPRSQAIPIFLSFGNPSEVKFQKSHKREKVELEELSTLPNAEVKVFRDGKIVVRKTQNYSDNEDSSEENEIKPRRGKRKGRNAETVIDAAEEGISPTKTRLKKKKTTDIEIVEPVRDNEDRSEENEIKPCHDKRKGRNAEAVIDAAEEGISPTKTRLKKKKTTDIEIVEPVRDNEDSSEENEIKPRRGKRKGRNAEAVDEDIIKKRKKAIEVEDKKKKTTDIEIVEPVRVLRKTQPKVKSPRNSPGNKRILRRRL